MHIIDSLPPRVDTVVLAVSYMKDVLEEYFRVNDCGRKVILVNETSPLGTGGAIKNVEGHLDDTFIVINGDVLTSIDINSMLKYHREKGGMGPSHSGRWRIPLHLESWRDDQLYGYRIPGKALEG